MLNTPQAVKSVSPAGLRRQRDELFRARAVSFKWSKRATGKPPNPTASDLAQACPYDISFFGKFFLPAGRPRFFVGVLCLADTTHAGGRPRLF